MMKYIEIQKVRETDINVDDTLVLRSNVHAFLEGDIISITEKIDGAQAHVRAIDGVLHCYSSKNELSSENTLRGFYDYVKSLDPAPFARYPDYEFFGEWLVPHTVTYDPSNYNKWYIFSVYDHATGKWLSQSFVKGFAAKYQFACPHELYYGPFRGWDHVYSFSHNPAYGSVQEGVVIKNQTALAVGREPHVLKYVNDDFSEIKIANHMRKQTDDYQKQIMSDAEDKMSVVVTHARVVKILHKMVDDGILPVDMDSSDMQIIAKTLPGLVYDDCVKEAPDIVDSAGKQAMKAVSKLSMQIVHKVFLI